MTLAAEHAAVVPWTQTVIYTLGAIVLTILGNAFIQSRQFAHQLDVRDRKISQAASDRLRAERAKAYGDFITAADGAWQTANDMISHSRLGLRSRSYRDQSRPAVTQLSRAYLALCLVATEPVCEAAGAYQSVLREIMIDASRGKWHTDGKEPAARSRVMTCMRAELGYAEPASDAADGRTDAVPDSGEALLRGGSTAGKPGD